MSKLLIEEPPLQVLPTLAQAIGLNEAIILQQIHYWLQRSKHKHDGRRWIYNTYEQWQAQLPFWSISTIRRALANLRNPYEPTDPGDPKPERGPLVLVGEYNVKGYDNTLWWTIDYQEMDRIEAVIRPSAQNEQTICPKRTDGSAQNEQTNTRDFQENDCRESEETPEETTEIAVLWKTAKQELVLQMTRQTFDQWLRPAELVGLENGQAVIGVASTYAVDWLSHRLRPVIERTLTRLLGREISADFVVTEGR